MTNKYSIALVLGTFALLTSCSESGATDTPSTTDTASMGEITTSSSADTNAIPTYRYVGFEAPITYQEESLYQSVFWYNGETSTINQSIDTSERDDPSSVSLTWSAPGTYTVSCKYSYYLGTEITTKSATSEVTVVQSHINNSLIGESLDVVKEFNPNLMVFPNNDNMYTETINSRSYYYKFDNNTLIEGSVYHTNNTVYTVESGHYPAYSLLLTECNKESTTGGYSFEKEMSKDVTYGVSAVSGFEINSDLQEAIEDFEKNGTGMSDESKKAICTVVENGFCSMYIKGTIIDNDKIERTIEVGFYEFKVLDGVVSNTYYANVVTKAVENQEDI